jgi:hypothetical protein
MDYIILDQLQQAMKKVSGGLITNPDANMANILEVEARTYATLDEVQRRGLSDDGKVAGAKVATNAVPTETLPITS